MKNFKTKKIDWTIIEYIWKVELWPNRNTPIKPTNGLLCNGGWNKDIEANVPTFFGVYDTDDNLMGINSGHKAELVNDKQYYRSRGIFVFPKYRGKGVAKMLLNATINQAIEENCDIIWSMPRASSLKTYKNVGFAVCSDEITEMEFGPNYYVTLKLKESNV